MNKASRRLFRNLLAGMVGLAAAALLVLATLQMQDYSTPAFLTVSLFIFPAPVACGLVVGLISPGRAIVWALLWAFVFAILLFSVLPGGINDAGTAVSTWRLVLTAAGIILAGAAGLVGQWASFRGLAGRVVAVFAALCCAMSGAGYGMLSHQMSVFQRDIVPQVALEVDRDYIRLPSSADWFCERQPATECYKLSTQVNGDCLCVLVSAGRPDIVGVTYRHSGDGAVVVSEQGARRYLADHGMRQALTSTLAEQKGKPSSWCASRGRTRLTLSRDGDIDITSLPEFRH